MTTATMPYAQFYRMMSNEEELCCLLEKLKADKRTKDLIEYTRDEHGVFHVKLKKPEQQENNVVEWHDLEKNPDDLPNYEVIHYVQTDFGEHVYYDKQRKVWRDIDDCIRCIPVAWCEIPRFKKSE